MERKKYLPDHYTEVEEPYFEGRGNHSVSKLEDICERYKEYTHQSHIILQRLQEENERLIKQLESVKVHIDEASKLSARVNELYNQTIKKYDLEMAAKIEEINRLREALKRCKSMMERSKVGGFTVTHRGNHYAEQGSTYETVIKALNS